MIDRKQFLEIKAEATFRGALARGYSHAEIQEFGGHETVKFHREAGEGRVAIEAILEAEAEADDAGRYMVQTCHGGTDYGVYGPVETRDPYVEYLTHAEALDLAREAAADLGTARVYDFSDGGESERA